MEEIPKLEYESKVFPPTEKLLRVELFGTPEEAHLAKGRLEAEGIEAFLDNENLVAMHQFLGAGATGGVGLRVAASQVDAARQILSTPAVLESVDGEALEDEGYADENWRCPKCHRKHVELVKLPTWLLLACLPLLGAPLAFIKRRKVCQDCGHRWQTE